MPAPSGGVRAMPDRIHDPGAASGESPGPGLLGNRRCVCHDRPMPAPRPDLTAAQPRRPSGTAGGRGGQWSNKPIADPPPGGGMALGEKGPPAAVRERLHRHGPPRHPSAKGVDKIKLTGPKVRGRRLQVTIRRDPGTGEWANPTMFGDETVRRLSDTPWNETGAEEAKGVHAQVFVDMLNAGDARPCPEHAKAALHGTVRAGSAWAGWDIFRPRQLGGNCDMVRIAAAVRAEMYFRDRLILWDQDQTYAGPKYCPIIYDFNLSALLNDREWDGEDGRLMERLAMLEDGKGRTMLDLRHDYHSNYPGHSDTHLTAADNTLVLPVYLLGIPELDETVKAECFAMLEQVATPNKLTWGKLIHVVAVRAVRNRCKAQHFTDSLSNVVRHYSADDSHQIKWGILEAINRAPDKRHWLDYGHDNSGVIGSEYLQHEVERHAGAGRRS